VSLQYLQTVAVRKPTTMHSICGGHNLSSAPATPAPSEGAGVSWLTG
jgi:hypothetical protein